MRTSLPLLAVVLAVSFFLTACGQSMLPTAEPSPSRTSTFTSTSTATSTATSTYPPSATPTSTPIPCDPSSADYCIVDGTFLLQRPIAPPGTDSVERSYAYGSTSGGTRILPHHGVEFSNASGTPVLAAADGTVVYAGDDTTTLFSRWPNFYGNLVVLEHALPGQTVYTLYAHLLKVDVTTGQSVTAGEKIAEVGASGGSHLHFEVRLDPQEYASTLNPELWLATFPGTGVLSLRFVDETGQFVQTQPNVQYFPDPTAPYTMSWQPEVYATELLNGFNWENAVLGNLFAGSYRISFYWAYRLNEKWVQIQAGKLTLVEFVVK